MNIVEFKNDFKLAKCLDSADKIVIASMLLADVVICDNDSEILNILNKLHEIQISRYL